MEIEGGGRRRKEKRESRRNEEREREANRGKRNNEIREGKDGKSYAPTFGDIRTRAENNIKVAIPGCHTNTNKQTNKNSIA